MKAFFAHTSAAILMLGSSWLPPAASAAPAVLDPKLAVRTIVQDLEQPIGIVFLGPQDFLVTEKASGKVKRVVNGVVTKTVLDLPVNSGSERGLLTIELHPSFRQNRWVYLYWTESSTGADSTELAEVGNPSSPYPPGTPQPLGNRVDRFVWDPTAETLTFDRNVITLRAYQADDGQPLRGNHNGGVIRFQFPDPLSARAGTPGHDPRRGASLSATANGPERLFIVIGDNGRRGVTQNLINGPFGPDIPDDAFGGPEPDNNHLTGVVLRMNDDGSVPADNPFFAVGAALGGEVGANLQKIFAYGIRNCFGLAVDPRTGDLWESENCDDAFDEMNRIEAGHNGGWIQIMGPVSRVAEFKAIETTPPFVGLQQIRWPPSNIADTPQEALNRLVVLPGSRYVDPLFSWKYATAPAAIGFLNSSALGPEYFGNLFVGASRVALSDGYLFRFKLTVDRRDLALSDPKLADRVADNTGKFDGTESESIAFGTGFGISTDIRTSPTGTLYVVSTSGGAVYEVRRAP